MKRRISVPLAFLALASCRHSERATVIVSNEDSGELTFIDAEHDVVERTIAVGKRPRGLRVSPDGKTLYVALSGSAKGGPPDARKGGAVERPDGPRDDAADGIGVVDIEKGVLTKVIASGRDPESFDVTPDGKRIYVSNEETAEVSVVELASGTVVKRVNVGAEPEGVAITPDGALVYVACEEDATVAILQTSNDEVIARVPVDKRPRAVAFAKDGRAFVTAESGGVVDVIDRRSHDVVARIPTGPTGVRPMGIAVTADGAHAFVSNGRAGSVAYLDLRSATLLRAIESTGARPWGIALLPDGKKLYVATGTDVAVVDTGINEVTKRVPAGRGPWGIAVAHHAR